LGLADSIKQGLYKVVSEELSKSITGSQDMIDKFRIQQLSEMEYIGESYKKNQEKLLKIQGFENFFF